MRDLKVNSFLGWTLKHAFLNSDLNTRETSVQLRFRTRDQDGVLLHLPSNTQEFITLEVGAEAWTYIHIEIMLLVIYLV